MKSVFHLLSTGLTTETRSEWLMEKSWTLHFNLRRQLTLSVFFSGKAKKPTPTLASS